jgi:hypothetical protein
MDKFSSLPRGVLVCCKALTKKKRLHSVTVIERYSDQMTHFLSIIIFAILGGRLCTAGDTLLPGQSLSGSKTLVSKNGVYELGLIQLTSRFGIRFVNEPEIFCCFLVIPFSGLCSCVDLCTACIKLRTSLFYLH